MLKRQGYKAIFTIPSMQTLALLRGEKEARKEQAYNEIGPEEAEAVAAVMHERVLSGFIGRAGDHFLGGSRVQQLEERFQEHFTVKHAVSFNSATTALQAAVTALGIGPGDEVITSPFTMSATPTAVLLNNAIPVFADIDPESFCLDPASVERCVTKKTRAILVVNLMGGSADYRALRRIADAHGLKIIEDNAQAPGGTYEGQYAGTIGDIGVFSLNVHKVIQCGEGGVLVTNDDMLAFRAQLVRNHGEVVMDDLQGTVADEPLVGSNYRMSEMHAAVAIEQLKKLERLNKERCENAAYLTEKLSAFPWLGPCRVAPGVGHVYYIYPLKFFAQKLGIRRNTFADVVRAEGFNVGIGYQKPIYWFPLYQQKRMFPHSQFPFLSSDYPSDVSYDKGICPVAERMYEDEMLILTIFQPPNGRHDIDAFVDVCRRVEAQVDSLKQYEHQPT